MSKKIKTLRVHLILILMLVITSINSFAQENQSTPIIKKAKNYGYRGSVITGVATGFSDYLFREIDVLTVHGIWMGPAFMGVGTGLTMLLGKQNLQYGLSPVAGYSSTAFALPLFVDLKIHFYNRDITPFVELQLGSSILLSKGLYVGNGWVNRPSATIFNIAIGIRTRKYKSLMFNSAFVMNTVSQGSQARAADVGTSEYFTLPSIGIRLGVEW